MSKFMPLGQDSIAISCHFSGRLFSADPDGMNIQSLEKTIVKQQPAQGYCFLSLRQSLELLSVIFSLEQKQVSAEFRA
ncbi:MAG: hypothetical protein AB7P44_02395 [Steroidobacteraceae bacterium]